MTCDWWYDNDNVTSRNAHDDDVRWFLGGFYFGFSILSLLLLNNPLFGLTTTLHWSRQKNYSTTVALVVDCRFLKISFSFVESANVPFTQ